MRSIKTKLMLYFGILITLACFGLGINTADVLEKSLIQSLQKTIPKITSLTSDNLRESINSNLDALSSFAYAEPIKNPNMLVEQKLMVINEEKDRKKFWN